MPNVFPSNSQRNPEELFELFLGSQEKKEKHSTSRMNEPHKLFALFEWHNKLFQLLKLLLIFNSCNPRSSKFLFPRYIPVSYYSGIPEVLAPSLFPRVGYIPRVVSTQELLYSPAEHPPLSTSLAPYALVFLPSTSSPTLSSTPPIPPPFPQWTLSRVSWWNHQRADIRLRRPRNAKYKADQRELVPLF